jgi:type IX secretion system PorP/SprF family membrane protein
MRKTKHKLLTVVFSLICLGVFGQQQVLTSNFMMNKLFYNPGFVVEEKSPVAIAQIRSQWLGVDGAPNLQKASFSMPFLNNRVGGGLAISNYTAGIISEQTVSAIYGYRLRFGRGSSMLMGMNLDLSSYGVNFDDDRLVYINGSEGDESVNGGIQSKFLFNVGLGAYFSADDFYVGFSIPGTIEENLDFTGVSDKNKGVRHFYFMAGSDFKLKSQSSIQPNILIRYVAEAYMNVELNLMYNIEDKLYLGGSYRNGGINLGPIESANIIIGTYLSPKLLLAVSYDITLSAIRNHSAGSFEVMLKYRSNKKDSKRIGNPRFM